jgi:seryl-tRNA synthetase
MELKFNLKGAFKTSADPTGAKEVIAQYFDEANNTILKKGAPEGQGAKITQWDIVDGSIELTIESGRYVRAHDAIIRLRKPLAAKLGKDFRIGIRGVDVKEFTISMPAEGEIAGY